MITAARILPGAERAHVYKAFHAGLLRLIQPMLRRQRVGPLERVFFPFVDDAHQMNDTVRALHRPLDRGRVEDVAMEQLDTVTFLQPLRAARIAYNGADRMG